MPGTWPMTWLRVLLREQAGVVAPCVAIFVALSLAAGVLRLLELVGR